MALRFGYTLMRVRPDDGTTHYDTVATEEFPVESDDELRDRKMQLRDWAVRQLTDLRPELALFYALYSTVDEYDEPSWPLSSLHFAWQGDKPVALAS